MTNNPALGFGGLLREFKQTLRETKSGKMALHIFYALCTIALCVLFCWVGNAGGGDSAIITRLGIFIVSLAVYLTIFNWSENGKAWVYDLNAKIAIAGAVMIFCRAVASPPAGYATVLYESPMAGVIENVRVRGDDGGNIQTFMKSPFTEVEHLQQQFSLTGSRQLVAFGDGVSKVLAVYFSGIIPDEKLLASWSVNQSTVKTGDLVAFFDEATKTAAVAFSSETIRSEMPALEARLLASIKETYPQLEIAELSVSLIGQ